MNQSHYFVEFNGYDYVVLMGVKVVAAFATCEEAFNAKRAFEEKPSLPALEKIPPAMRQAKEALYLH